MTDDDGAYMYIAKPCAGNDPTTAVGVPFGFDIICAAILLGGFVDRMINSVTIMIVTVRPPRATGQTFVRWISVDQPLNAKQDGTLLRLGKS